FVKAEFADYAGLKAKLQVKGNAIEAKVSKGFENASREALMGLAIALFNRLLHKKTPNPFVFQLKEFYSRKTTAKLGESLRALHGHKVKAESKGTHFDLEMILDNLLILYPDTFASVKKPLITWSKQGSKRVLGTHDSAKNIITVNKKLDAACVPFYVVEYIVFHELLHVKHEVLYQRGESMRRTVHPGTFKKDEARYLLKDKAEDWIRTRF
ncbi:MAG: hypothetical protein V1834_04460, partial [Candidatus Micrarchaeota archaeon]